MTSLEQNLRADLDIIRTNWADLLDLPRTPGGDKVDTSTASQAPLAISVLSMRFDAMQTLGAWSHLVWDEQHLTSRLNLMDVPALCKFLDIHSGFLARHIAGRDACEEIALIASKVTELIGQTTARRFIVGSCVVDNCTGLLAATLQSGVSLPSEIGCTTNPDHRWSPDMWAYMARVASNACP